jgi:thiamine-monophosphate kinase
VIFGRHFDASVPPRAAGEKLVKRNLSDIAAMGGRPVAAVVALTLDARVNRRWLEAFYRGIAAAARRYGVDIVGGDVAQADGIVAANLTLIGEAAADRIVTRQGARRGDWIFVTGELGGSVASGHHFRFRPRLPEGAWLARQRDVRAMIDVSDGLAKDLPALTPSGMIAVLHETALPRRRRADLRSALTEGEDYELLFAVAGSVNPETWKRAWRRAFPRTRLSCVGQFVTADAVPAGALTLAKFHGYEHLRASENKRPIR